MHSQEEVMSQDRNVRFRRMNHKTSFCPVYSLVYSGTKRSTTSEGLKDADGMHHDVRKRKRNIQINNSRTHRTVIQIPKTLLALKQVSKVLKFTMTSSLSKETEKMPKQIKVNYYNILNLSV